MCDTYTPAGEPLPTNARYKAEKIFSHPDVVAEEPWYVLIYSFRVFHSCPTSLLFLSLPLGLGYYYVLTCLM